MIIHELLCNDCFLNFHNIIIFLKKENRFKNNCIIAGSGEGISCPG